MDLIGEERGKLARVAGWLDASPAETLGLVLLLAGGVVATLVLVWGAVGRPATLPGSDGDVAGGEAAGGEVAGGEVAALGTPAGEDEHGEVAGDAGVHGDPHGHDHAGGAAHGGDATGGGVGGAAGDVTVHVAGAVVRPGIVTLPAGARVDDAIDAAGGPTADADPSLVNLARPLVDGEQVRVPVEGEDPPPEPAGGAGPAGGGASGGAPGAGAGAAGGPVDLNRAGVAELETLPGIGPSLAQRIVDHREQHGPFRTPGDLRDVSGIGEKRFQDLADRVTVG